MFSACRLPKLESLVLNTPGADNYPLAGLFINMRQRLTQLRKLTISGCNRCQPGWLDATAAWQQLVSIRQLTSLYIKLQSAPVHLADLNLLGQLTALEALEIDAPGAQWDEIQHSDEQDLELAGAAHDHGGDVEQVSEEEEDEDEQQAHEQQEQHQAVGQAAGHVQQRERIGLCFLQQLTALTSLRVILPTHTGFENVRSCQQLKRLCNTAEFVNGVAPRVEPCLSTAQCGVLSSLTCLTELFCGGIKEDDMPVFYAAIQDLRHLETLNGGPGTEWTLDALPVLASLPRLTQLGGAWQQGPCWPQAVAVVAAPNPATAAVMLAACGSLQVPCLLLRSHN